MRLLIALLVIPGLVAASSFVEGVSGYLNGTAVLWGAGYPGSEYSNLDPKYRVYRQTSGCFVWGTEILTHVPNNLAITVLTDVFGPMRGTYHGPYPSREEASGVLRGTRDIVALEALQSAPQPAQDCQALAARFPPREDQPVARCAMFRDQTIVLGHFGQAVLVDAQTGTVYARYRVE
jgi:hypothetical protein